MKRLLIILFLIVFVFPAALAQTVENWNGLVVPQNTIFGVHFVIKPGATFGGLSYKDRTEIDPAVETEFNNEVQRCINAANSYFRENAITAAKTFHFSPKYEDRKNLIIFYVKSVSENGDTVADVKIVTSEFLKEATIRDLWGKGGRFGCFTNLMGDGFESLGEELAKRINKAVWLHEIEVTE